MGKKSRVKRERRKVCKNDFVGTLRSRLLNDPVFYKEYEQEQINELSDTDLLKLADLAGYTSTSGDRRWSQFVDFIDRELWFERGCSPRLIDDKKNVYRLEILKTEWEDLSRKSPAILRAMLGASDDMQIWLFDEDRSIAPIKSRVVTFDQIPQELINRGKKVDLCDIPTWVQDDIESFMLHSATKVD